jgi:hypothetical protein
MPIAIDQADIGGNSEIGSATSIAFNTSATVAVGADIFMLVRAGSDVTMSSFTGGGLTWTEEHRFPSTPDVLFLYRATAPAGLASGTTITATFSATNSNRIIEGCSFTGLSTAVKEDSNGNEGEAVSSWVGDTVTAISQSNLVISALTMNTDIAHTPTAPSLEAFDKGATFDYRLSMIYRINAAAGVYTNAGSWSGGSGFWMSATAAYAGAGETVITSTFSVDF